MKRIISILTVAAFLSPVLFAQNYSVDATNSSLGWTGEKVTGAHNGTIGIKQGMFKVDDAMKMTGEFEIDMTSIVVLDIEDPGTNAKLVSHLKNADFFDSGNHPSSTFEITKAVPYRGENANYRVTGKLTIKGITNEISFPAQIDFTDDSFMAKAQFSIDRSRWEIKYGSGSFFDALGDKLIYDDIKFDLNITGAKG
ncbi:MAG: YceI family protein [Calditrichota bacterium]